MSAWAELVCFLASFFLVSLIDAILSIFLSMFFQGKQAGVCFGFELAFFLLDVFLVGSTNVLLQVSPNVSANLSKEIT